jgi:hypothetical protein
MIEILFYLSLAATLFLLFLLINHLKTRIVTLETQNEGLMDIIKLLRGNMVSSDGQQKNLNDRLVYLERKSSNSYPVHSENITLEISPVRKVDVSRDSMRNNKISVSDEDDYVLPVYDLERSGDDSGDDSDSGEENEEVEGHLETIDIPYPADVSGFIDIQKMNYGDDEDEEYENDENNGEINAKQIDEFLQIQGFHGNGMSAMEKMMMIMSLGQGFPGAGFGNMSMESEMEILEDDDSDLPDLVEDDDVPVSDVSELPVSDVTVTELPVSELPVSDVSELPVTDVVADVVTDVVSEVLRKVEEKETEKESETVDYHKLDIKTLRQIAQDLHLKENVKNLKKTEIIKLLSSQAKV